MCISQNTRGDLQSTFKINQMFKEQNKWDQNKYFQAQQQKGHILSDQTVFYTGIWPA